MRFLTAGESHGKQLTAVIEGVPSGFDISIDKINSALHKRQMGYGRGKRMEIEKDQVRIMSGVRHGKTIGSPITLVIENKDYDNWLEVMSTEISYYDNSKIVTRPRPGHADLNGGIKYNHKDLRNILERSSARETAIRVAVGALAEQLIAPFGINFFSHVVNIGGINSDTYDLLKEFTIDEFKIRLDNSEVRCVDYKKTELMIREIDKAKESGDTLGGVVEVIVFDVPIGLGSHVHWDKKLDGRLGCAILSIQGFKGVEIGLGYQVANVSGSKVHDEIKWSKENGFYRSSNRAGGIEGGITNGEPLIIRGVMKPIPTLYKPLSSIDIETKEPYLATVERSDICAVPAASIVAENVVAWEIANAFFEKFSGDSYYEINNQFKNYNEQVGNY